MSRILTATSEKPKKLNSKAAQENEAAEIELEPDARLRFERFIKASAKAGPQHREVKPAPKNSGAENKTPAK